jgi:hypothetical protein
MSEVRQRVEYRSDQDEGQERKDMFERKGPPTEVALRHGRFTVEFIIQEGPFALSGDGKGPVPKGVKVCFSQLSIMTDIRAPT